jgi:hypothetical protein
MAIWETSDMQ